MPNTQPKEPFLPGFPELPTAKDLELSKYSLFLRVDPFHLPDAGKYHIAVTGGRTSSYLLYRVLERNGGLPDNAVAIFTNTGREAEETLEFLRKIEDTGIRADEPNRAAVAWLRECQAELPLMSAGITRSEILRFWSSQPFQLNTPYGNCDFCFMKPQKLIRKLALQFPDRLKWWVKLEETENYGKGFTFRRETSMRSIAQIAEPLGNITLDDEELNLTCYCGDD